MSKYIAYILSKIKSVRNYLAYQLFAYFGLTFAILLAITLAIPNFDARSFLPIETDERDFFQQESHSTEMQYNLDEIFERKLSVATTNGFDVILLDWKTGVFVGVDPHTIKSFQVFLYRADSPAEPLQRRFGNLEIYGPFLVKSSKREYFQYFAQSVDPQEELFNQIFDSPWLMLLIVLGVSIPILLWLSWKISRPVKALRLSANAVATGNFAINPALETEGINELREVGKTFNQMITSLQDLTLHQQRLVSDISHELKTPLARLHLATALIRRRNGESPELTRIENQIQKLDTMVHDLLVLSRQQVNQHLTREIFSINKIWDDLLEDAKFDAEQNHLDLFISQRITHPENFFINGNQNILASAMENVIRNAQKYAKKSIKVLTYIDNTDLIIAIDDDGKGIPETEYQQIFRPFYRVDEARDRQTGGTGLGLAIVANAVQQHKGSVQAMKSPLGGLRIEIKLPLWIE
ncbi:envelope stress sensor histidine kinase CpxA [Actinobacillus pleuropneumoniae]|uniref:envelope stress sensor histidine kinase CpxA n=1 Tax=Actinobacillus pleuropneumoniae TaxID=715 RepID=UPI001EEEC555|nr:envelope stress sensor histidine kinase CpxA [Actinobacillus pleuropneumoniae]UKH38774.1 two-component system sensor histidine kinase CpxA [Actinobacillus pleuropneumoniae]